MKLFTKIILLFFIGMSTSFISNAHGSFNRSNIGVSAGLSGIINVNINYEYRVSNSSFISLGYGKLSGMGDAIPHIDLTHVFLIGNYNHLFEFGYGLFVFDPFDDMDFLPNLRLGYRHINDYNSAFFRTGISGSEGIYLGFGRSF